MRKKYNNRSHKMYNSIMHGLQEIIDDVRSKNDRTDDSDSNKINDVPGSISTEDSLVNIIPEDIGADNK